MIDVKKTFTGCITTAIVLWASVLSGLSQTSQASDAFECKEFWISKNANWKIAYDDVKYCSSELIVKSKDSVYGVLFPGSLTLCNDTISIIQEAGLPNACIKVGKVKVGEIVRFNYPHENIEFKILNDTIIEFDERPFIRVDKSVLYGCWCNWKQAKQDSIVNTKQFEY